MAEATQTKTTIAIDPVTRIEGHLKAEVVVENGKVVDAKLTGGMYRGFESILRGRHPRDAAQIVQRIYVQSPEVKDVVYNGVAYASYYRATKGSD